MQADRVQASVGVETGLRALRQRSLIFAEDQVERATVFLVFIGDE